MDWNAPLAQELRLATSDERISLARTAHSSVVRGSAVIFASLAAVILGVGLLAIPQKTSTVGVLLVAGAFLAVPLAIKLWVDRIERRARQFLEEDGTTVMRADARGVGVAGVEIPYERITCLFATVEQEHYSPGGHFGGGSVQARVGLAAGGVLGTGLRRRLYRDGAKSAIFLCIGVDRKAALGAWPGIVEKVPMVPQRGDDPGRIVVPFGAYLGVAELAALLEYVQRQTGGRLFPMGLVSGTLGWASAQVAPSGTREEIWAESKGMLP